MDAAELGRIKSLLERLNHDDHTAFDEFIREYSAQFTRFLSARGFNQSEATALGPDCATQVLVKLHHFDGSPQGFRSWCFTVARHYAEDQRRKQRGIVFEEIREDTASTPADEFLERTEDFAREADLVLTEASLMVQEKLALLAEVDRRIIEMHTLNGKLSFSDIALELGIKEGTARVRFHRAMKKLEQFLRADPRLGKFIRARM